jgi:hypothetical protein
MLKSILLPLPLSSPTPYTLEHDAHNVTVSEIDPALER